MTAYLPSLRPLALLLAAIALFIAGQARAQVTVTFWSHEFGSSFPHAFFTLHGTLQRGGAPVDLAYGFTAKAVTPAILLGTVPGRIDYVTRRYAESSNAHFSLVITDAQYAALIALVREWSDDGGDNRYSLNRRNCVHFVAEAMRRVGLDVVEDRKLMKKPRSFTQSIAARNAARVARIEQPGKDYFASLPALPAAPAAAAVAAPAR